MFVGKLVFAQLMDHLPWKSFARIVQRYGGDHRVRHFSCANQFRCMAFAQLTYRESLRDIEACLQAQRSKLYHLGIHGNVARSTLADANEARDWRIYADFAQQLIGTARRLYVEEPFGLELKETVYALDATPDQTLPVAVSVGNVSLDQGGGEIAHLARFARQHSGLHPHQRWAASRDERPGSAPSRARRLLCDGPRLRRFRGTAPLPPGWRLLRASCSIHSQRAAPLFGSRGTQYRTHLRSDCTSQFVLLQAPFPRSIAPDKDPRCPIRQIGGAAHQQFRAARTHDRRTLPLPLAGGTVLQMDQAASSDQSFLRYLGERRQDADLDRGIRLRARGHNQKAPSSRCFPL